MKKQTSKKAPKPPLNKGDVSSLLIFLDNHINRSMELLKRDEIANEDAKHFSILGQMTAYNEVRKFVKKINNC